MVTGRDGAGIRHIRRRGAHRLATVRMKDRPRPDRRSWARIRVVRLVSGRDEAAWPEVTTVCPETYLSTLHSIDRDFRQAALDLAVDGQIVCPPSWQRLEP